MSCTAVLNPRRELAAILASLAGHYQKAYCYPSQLKILELYRGRTGAAMSRRTLNRHLKALERDGWFERRRRHRADKVRGMTFRSTLYVMTRRAFRWLGSIARSAGRAARWSRVPQVAQQMTSSQALTSPAAPRAPPADGRSEAATKGVAALRAALHKK